MRHASVNAVSRFSFLYRIGQCPTCMRQSFIAAAGCTGLYLMAALLIGRAQLGLVLDALLYLAVASVLLWVLHMLVYGVRTVINAPAVTSLEPARRDVLDRGGGELAVPTTRRSLMRLFVRAVAGAVTATALPGMAMAWGECRGRLNCGWSSCGSNYCCPKGYPILNLCNCRCYQNVQGVVQAGCRSTGSCFDEDF